MADGKSTNFPSKAQALCAAIELAEKDGKRGHAPEVLVRHEDDRFITEWVYGEDLHRTKRRVQRLRPFYCRNRKHGGQSLFY
jgi:hypothetical protein